MRIESSIITSLSELRAIEQQRIADERAAIERDRANAIEAARAAEQARVDAQEARARAEREDRMRIEIARAEAERDARLRVEAHEASERARLAAQLEERRVLEEMDLRRAEVAKKRPTWMLVVTALAGLAAVGLMLFAIDQSRNRQRAQEKQQQAIAETERAKQELREWQEKLTVLKANVDKFDGELVALQKRVDEAQSAADRQKAADELAAAGARKREAQRQLDLAAAKRERDKRMEIIDVSKCVGNATGCLKMK